MRGGVVLSRRMDHSTDLQGVHHDRAYLAELEETAAAITARAGRLLLERYQHPVVLEFKDEKKTDPVTETDRAVERLVRQALRSTFPTHGILGEEGTAEATTAELVWVLDPLDGTANFAGRLPFFGVSLALLRNGVPIVGCLFVPYGPGLHSGVLRCSYGNGASIDGRPLRLERRPFQGSGPVALPPSFRWAFKLSGETAKRPGELRNLGSICYELAMVVGGGFQYASFVRPRIWDVAAGVLLVREAGGLALTWDRGGWRPLERFVAPLPGPDGKATSLRDWARPILVGAPETIAHIAPGFRLREPPARLVRWALAGRRGTGRIWHRRRGRAAKRQDGGEDGTSRP